MLQLCTLSFENVLAADTTTLLEAHIVICCMERTVNINLP